MGVTLKAMKRVAEIQKKREQRFYESRMKAAKVRERSMIRLELERNMELIKPAAAVRDVVVDKLREKQRAAASAAAAATSAEMVGDE